MPVTGGCSRRGSAGCSERMDLQQLGTGRELGADGAIELVGPAGFGVDERKSAADRRVVGPAVDGAGIVLEKNAAALRDPGAPLPPAGPEDHRGSMSRRHLRRFRIRQGGPIGATSRLMRTG